MSLNNQTVFKYCDVKKHAYCYAYVVTQIFIHQ